MPIPHESFDVKTLDQNNGFAEWDVTIGKHYGLKVCSPTSAQPEVDWDAQVPEVSHSLEPGSAVMIPYATQPFEAGVQNEYNFQAFGDKLRVEVPAANAGLNLRVILVPVVSKP